MATLTQAKNSVHTYLSEMGLNPSGLKLISYDADKDDNYWLLEGKFQEGFMGGYYKFNAKYNPLTDTIGKMNVEEMTGSTEGYA